MSRYPGTTTSENGRATLTATPSKVGQYAVLVTYANGTATLTKATTINSYCPDGQIELPAGCGTELTPLPHWHENVILANPPDGYELAQFCKSIQMTAAESEELTGNSRAGTLWTCRHLVPSREYIRKTDAQINSTSEHIDGYGTRLVLESKELLEGCQSITAEHWQCDYRGDSVWTRTYHDGDESDYVWDAFISGVVNPTRCATFLTLTWGTGAANPLTSAATIGSCATLFTS